MLKNTLIFVYILVVLAISVGARAEIKTSEVTQGDLSELQNYNYKTYAGQIVALVDGSLFLAIEGTQTALKLDSKMDLTPFIGFNILVSGIELGHQLAPQVGLESVDPLPAFGSGSSAVTFFVFDIKEVTN